ncbi:hypothetical protein FSP39_019390 [Pinctada imbricata]|uniref:UBX domain-containing protein 11 n=1 Tax=Pinctada imbricata TaxID=66713 RepID=A0AA89C7T1_PINIB|nr:hypothetical protein FSP39_019390 [Pinctada imbricata]
MATARLKTHRDPFDGGLPKLSTNRSHVGGNQSPSPRLSHPSGPMGSGPSDHELMTAMMTRIGLLEQKLTTQAKDINDKAFLADYGMIWVGEKSDPKSEVYNDTSSTQSSGSEEEEYWRPATSLSSHNDTPDFTMEFNKVLENIKDLNVLAGEGVSKVQHTTDGARLKMPDAVPLTLYANGIVMYSGPFRPYNDPSTQQCMQDIMDGYFPTELQKRYPDGVPFAISRDVTFKTKRQDLFTGSGQVLGGETKPSRLVEDVKHSGADRYRQSSSKATAIAPANTPEITPENTKIISEIPGRKMTVGQFLDKLPKSVIKGGKVIDIRSSIGDTLSGGQKESTGVTVVETDSVLDMKKRLDEDESIRPLTPRNITTLRIKAETGNHTYILKMKFHETIGDLRKYINMQRGRGPNPYDIMSAYPNKVYSDESATLESCGLTPNAVLHLRHRKR